MQDVMNRNPLAVTGTPTLVAGALTQDTDQGVQFAGPTSSASAADSASLSITGSLSLECFINLPSLPASTKDIVLKSGSYGIAVDSSGHVIFTVTGPSASAAVTSVSTLTTNRWYHIVCVYNGNYAGAQQLGNASVGSQYIQVDDDNSNNKAVGKFVLPESAVLNDLNVALEYRDEIWTVQMCAVVYGDSGGVPGALVTKSDVALLTPPTPQWRVWTWVSFPLASAVVPAGTYYLGFVADTISGLSKAPLVVAGENSGGSRYSRPDSVSSPSSPFGASVVTTNENMSVYCDYTAVGRSGLEGSALVYIDGALNGSEIYSGGVADTSNVLTVCPSVTAQVDELSIWNKPLTDVQVATHYTAH